MARRHIVVTLEGRSATVRGYGSRSLIMDITGRAPMYLSRRRAWDCRASTARDVIAHAERLGYRVTVSGEAKPAKPSPVVASSGGPEGEHHEPEAGLW